MIPPGRHYFLCYSDWVRIQQIMKNTVTDLLERQELIQKLIDKGYGPLIEALLMNEGKVYTKKGRLNKSGACRVLGWKTKELEDALDACREILQIDFHLD